MNTYGYMVFDTETALKDWDVGFGLDKGYNEKEGCFEFEAIVLNDKRTYEPRTKKDGTTFTPSSNDLEKFIVRVDEQPKDFKKFEKISLVDVYDSFLIGVKTYSPTPVIACEKIIKA